MAIQWYQYVRDICSRCLVQNPVRFGGPGTVVQVDESLMANQKQGVPSHWVFGMYDCNRRIGILEFVPCCDSNRILSIIIRYVLLGKEIHSDQRGAYRAILAVPSFLLICITL